MDIKTENKKFNKDCNGNDTIIQVLKAGNSKRIATSLNENNNHIKAMSDLNQANIVMKDQTIREQAKELQEQRNILNILSSFLC